MADAQLQMDYPKGITFEQVWAALMEDRELFKKSQQEFDRNLKESKQEFDRQVKDMNKRFGEFSNRFGEIVEYMVAPSLNDKFNELGFAFQRTNNNSKFSDIKNNIKFEVDIILENGQKAILVEVKSKLTTEDVKNHIERLKKMRKYADLHNDNRIFLGAVATVVTLANVKEFALNKGLFVIEPIGESLKITSPNNNLKEW